MGSPSPLRGTPLFSHSHPLLQGAGLLTLSPVQGSRDETLAGPLGLGETRP